MEVDADTFTAQHSEQIIFAGSTNETNGLEYEETCETDADEAEYVLEQDPMANTEDDQLGEAEYLEDELVDELKHEKDCAEDAPDEEADECLEPKDDALQLDDEIDKQDNEDSAKIYLIDSKNGDEIIRNGADEVASSSDVRSGAVKEDFVEEQQCRVCTSAEDLVSLFDKIEKNTPADMLMTICPSVSIATKDYMPQFICNSCLDNVTIALQLKAQLESTERELRKKLSRSKNKIRRPRGGYVVIDAPDSDPPSEEELNDDVEFKVSDEAISSPGSDSDDSDVSAKKKRTQRGFSGRRGRRRTATGAAIGASTARTIKRDYIDIDNRRALPQRKRNSFNSYGQDNRSDLTCEVCSKSFKINRAYISHCAKHDSCPKCKRLFKNRTELRRHILQTHGDTNILYDCKKCQRTFTSDTRLRQHRMEECDSKPKKKTEFQSMTLGKDLFKSVAPLTTTYWSDSFSD